MAKEVSPRGYSLSLWFDIDPSSVVRIIYKLVPELWRYFQNQISWPNLHEWATLMGNWPEFPNAVGAIDTPHENCRPLTEPQWPFYSGYRHYYCMNTQLVRDNEGHIRFVQAGFLRSTHDAVYFQLMEPISPRRNLDFLPNAKLLADKDYPDGGPLLTRIRANQMTLLNNRERRRARRFNRLFSKRRVKVEHVFKFLKGNLFLFGYARFTVWSMALVFEKVRALSRSHKHVCNISSFFKKHCL